MRKSRTRMLLQSQVEKAVEITRSNRAAAQYLRVSYSLFKKFAMMYTDPQGVPYFNLHKNQSGRGVQKVHFSKLKFSLDDILLGKHPTYSPAKLLRRMINNGVIAEKCNHCGFSQKRPTDLKAPIILHHINGEVKDHRRDNLELLCYNCYYVLVGNLPKKVLNPNAQKFVTPEASMQDPDILTLSSLSESNSMEILSDEEKIELMKRIQEL